MAYSSNILQYCVAIYNRTEAQQGDFGLDGSGIEFELAGSVRADVTWARGKQAMNAGALDVYGVIMVRMRWNRIINERSQIEWDGKRYQILGDTFHASYHDNTIQFHAQQIINH